MSAVRRDRGFSAVELVLVMAILGIATISLSHTVLSGQRTMTFIEDDTRVFDQAQVLMSRLNQIPFGTGNETAAPAASLAMLVAVENDLFGSATGGGVGPGYGQGGTANGAGLNLTQTFTGANVALTQVRLASPMTWEYAANGNAWYGNGGTWQIVVDRDLNGDGDLLDPLEVATAVGQDLLRVEILHDGRRILRTVRSRNPSE